MMPGARCAQRRTMQAAPCYDPASALARNSGAECLQRRAGVAAMCAVVQWLSCAGQLLSRGCARCRRAFFCYTQTSRRTRASDPPRMGSHRREQLCATRESGSGMKLQPSETAEGLPPTRAHSGTACELARSRQPQRTAGRRAHEQCASSDAVVARKQMQPPPRPLASMRRRQTLGRRSRPAHSLLHRAPLSSDGRRRAKRRLRKSRKRSDEQADQRAAQVSEQR